MFGVDIEQPTAIKVNEYCYKLVPPKYDSVRRVKLDNVIWELLKREKSRQHERCLQAGQNAHRLYVDEDGRLNTDGRGETVRLVMTCPDGTHRELARHGICFAFGSENHRFVLYTSRALAAPRTMAK